MRSGVSPILIGRIGGSFVSARFLNLFPELTVTARGGGLVTVLANRIKRVAVLHVWPW